MVTDPGGAGFDGGWLRVDVLAGSHSSALDQLRAPDDLTQDNLGLRTGDGIVLGSGGVVTVDGVTVGTLVSAGLAGARFEIALGADTTAAMVEPLVENLAFRNTSDDPQEARTLRIQIANGEGQASDPVLVTPTITPERNGVTRVPEIDERQANTHTASDRSEPHVAAIGRLLMVWTSDNRDATTT